MTVDTLIGSIDAMSIRTLIGPTSLRDYAKSQGWRLLKEAARDRLYVMTHPRFERRQLVFPMDSTAPDYAEAVMLMVEKLAVLESRSPQAVLRSLLEVDEDGLGFRVASPRLDDRSLPLSFVVSMIEGAQRLLLASACTVLKPQLHHPRLSRTEAQQFLETTRFRHTEPGSFVLNVSCPVHGVDVGAPLFPEYPDIPFARRATLTLQRSLRRLVEAVETDSLEDLVDTTRADALPLISSNLCEALTRFEDTTLRNSVEIAVRWAVSIPHPQDEGPVSVIRVQHDYFSRIEEVGRELRATERYLDDTFIGTVERLDGDMDADGRRSGEVVLSLLLPEGEQVRARTSLDSEQYAIADRAHMKEGVYVMVRGRLQPGRQPRQLTDLRVFELLQATAGDA